MLIINLTPSQIDLLAPSFAQLSAWESEGKPGALYGQIYGDHMRIGLMSNETVTAIYEALGTPPEKRVATRSAYDLRNNQPTAHDIDD